MALPVVMIAGLAGCAQILGVDDVAVVHRIGGQVRGLWDGADGVALRLQAGGTDALFTVTANGAFHFAERLDPGTSYAVAVVANPVLHTCVIDGGGNGMVADADVTSVSIACTGPATSITLSGLWGWTFDPTQETQTFAGSVAVQDVVLTVSGSELASARVNGVEAMLGQPLPALALPLGTMMVPVAVTARSGLSKTYQLVFDRGGSVLKQSVYAKASNPGVNGNFGISVALSGDTLVIGAYGEASRAIGVNPPGGQSDSSAPNAGAVYVFVRTGTTWTQQAYLKASNTEAGDYFGASVALSGDTLAVGAYGEASGATGVNPTGGQADNSRFAAGAVYVFVRTGTTWTQQAYVKASNIWSFNYFGYSVAVAGDTLAVGAHGSDSGGAVYVFVRTGTTWTQQASLKGSNTGLGDQFGWSVALSGATLAVGAFLEDSAATGVNPAGGQSDNSADGAGAVYVFVRSGTTWTQEAYLKASNTGAGDNFGASVALSGDTLAVGATGEASGAIGINPGGGQADNSARDAGAVYVFVRSGTTWTQEAYLKASNTGAGDNFGHSVALSGDTLAVGATDEASDATGGNPASGQADNSASNAGAAYVFVRSGATWTQEVYLKASNTGVGDWFGWSVALCGDTLAVGALAEDSGATGVNPAGGQADNSATSSGAAYVFR
ncbi:MAG TPA: FG-GAP repeat protein [Kofleriaceae bacterium]|nr:FG-GAP repeat protein [Kofleriaceae bacterium]